MSSTTRAGPATLSKGEQTRAALVACARQLFYRKGYEHTSFSDIVEASNLQRGNIYHYFKTKDEILKAVIDEHLADFRLLLEQWDRQHTDPRSKLQAFVQMITGRRMELVQFGCPIGSLNIELGKDHRELQHDARALFDLFLDWLTARFAELGYGDEAKPLAIHLLGRAQGIAVMAQVYRDTKLLKREAEALSAWIAQLPSK